MLKPTVRTKPAKELEAQTMKFLRAATMSPNTSLEAGLEQLAHKHSMRALSQKQLHRAPVAAMPTALRQQVRVLWGGPEAVQL